MQKIMDPYLLVQPLKLATSNLVHNLGLGSSLPRNNFYDQNWRRFGLWEYPKMWDPLFIFATAKASNFKFGTRGLGEHPKNLGPYLFLQRLKLATSISDPPTKGHVIQRMRDPKIAMVRYVQPQGCLMTSQSER